MKLVRCFIFLFFIITSGNIMASYCYRQSTVVDTEIVAEGDSLYLQTTTRD